MDNSKEKQHSAVAKHFNEICFGSAGKKLYDEAKQAMQGPHPDPPHAESLMNEVKDTDTIGYDTGASGEAQGDCLSGKHKFGVYKTLKGTAKGGGHTQDYNLVKEDWSKVTSEI